MTLAVAPVAARRRRLEPAEASAWVRVLQDVAALIIAAFLFVYGALAVENITILSLMYVSGGALIGVPIARRVDDERERRQ